MNNLNNHPTISTEKLRLSFTQAANSLTAFYKESLKSQNEAYLQGQIDALNEILDYSLKKYNGDIRNIPTTSMLEFINLKILELNTKKNNEIFKENNGNQIFQGSSLQNGFLQHPNNEDMRFNASSQFNK